MNNYRPEHFQSACISAMHGLRANALMGLIVGAVLAVVLSFTSQSAYAQVTYSGGTPKDSARYVHIVDSLAVLPDGASLYSPDPIWVDTAEKYNFTENYQRFDAASVRPLLSGIKLSKAQLDAVDRIVDEYLRILYAYYPKRPPSVKAEALGRRALMLYSRLHAKQASAVRALLSPEQVIKFDANVRAHDESSS